MGETSGMGIWAAWLVGAYLAGSIPFGLLLGLAQGVDIRTQGSGNVGATNAGRVLGRRWGLLCFALDVAKGLVPVLSYSLMMSGASPWGGSPTAAALAAIAVAAATVLGHIFPVWLGFRGGKGVATGLGALLGLWPVLTLPAAGATAVWLLVVRQWSYVSAASVAAAVALPPLVLASGLYHRLTTGEIAVYVAITGVLAGLVVVRHRSNLAKLRAGTEPKVAWAKRG